MNASASVDSASGKPPNRNEGSETIAPITAAITTPKISAQMNGQLLLNRKW